MFHIAAHLPEILTEAKEAVQNVAALAVAQISTVTNKDLKNLAGDLFANDPMRDDVSMPVGADIDMTMANEAAVSPLTEDDFKAAPFDFSEIEEAEYTQEEMDKLVDDFFSQI